MEGCKSYLPVFSIICQYFRVFPRKCHWHGKYAYLPPFCQPWFKHKILLQFCLSASIKNIWIKMAEKTLGKNIFSAPQEQLTPYIESSGIRSNSYSSKLFCMSLLPTRIKIKSKMKVLFHPLSVYGDYSRGICFCRVLASFNFLKIMLGIGRWCIALQYFQWKCQFGFLSWYSSLSR